jgi:hypothetical protein
MRVVPRLLDEIAHPAAHRFDREIDAAPPGHYDHRQQPIDLLHPREQIDPFAARRGVAGVIQIHQDQIERPRAQRRDRGVGRGHGVVLDPLPLEQETQRVEQVGLVVGDQDPRRHVTGNRSGHVVAADVQAACHRSL